jgi:hypothetical protein
MKIYYYNSIPANITNKLVDLLALAEIIMYLCGEAKATFQKSDGDIVVKQMACIKLGVQYYKLEVEFDFREEEPAVYFMCLEMLDDNQMADYELEIIEYQEEEVLNFV